MLEHDLSYFVQNFFVCVGIAANDGVVVGFAPEPQQEHLDGVDHSVG